MTETLGFVFKDALIGSQCRFAALQKRRKTVPDECDELVTILSLALFVELPIKTTSACSPCSMLHKSTIINS
jgi:hypothetical protein